MNRRCVTAAVLLAAALLCAAPVHAETLGRPNSFVMSVKGGEVELTDARQPIAGAERQFNEDAANFLALEFETRFQDENAAVGGEIMRYTNRYRRTTVTEYEDSMRSFAVLATGKFFFGDGRTVEPYLGGGIGVLQVHDYDGPIEGLSSGLAAKAVLGLQVRGDRFGGRLEVFHLHGSVDDDKGDEINASARGVLLGATFFFGPRRPR
jgi:outer membrane protein W